METMFTVRKLATLLLSILLLSLALANFVYAYPTLAPLCLELVQDSDQSVREKVTLLETTINEEFFSKNLFIEAYGLVQSTLGKEEMDSFEIAKDQQGKLHYGYFQTEPADVVPVADAVALLAETAEEAGGQFLCLMPPSKQIQGYTTFSPGLAVPDENAAIDAFLAELAVQNLNALDLRQTLGESGIAPENLFFTTDHHWKIPTAFWAFTQTVDCLETQFDISLDPDGLYTDLDNYNQILYPASFLGSMGRTLGAGYSGIDDFTLIYPKFDGEFSIFARNRGEVMLTIHHAHFQQALLSASFFNEPKDIMDISADKYFAYLRGNYGFTTVTNHTNPDGAKILFVKDSLAVPVAAFLASTCAQVDLIDPRWYEQDVLAYVADNDYDLVIFCVSAPNLTPEFTPFADI